MRPILVSIIIPVFNRQEQISNAIESVLLQTYSNWELILIDDCSTDSSVDVMKSFTDPRIRIHVMDRNSGPAAARNYGIMASRGRFISFLDSDDYFLPEFLECTLLKLAGLKDEIGFVWTGAILKYGDKEIRQPFWNPLVIDSPYLTFLHDLRIGAGAGIVVRKNVFDEIGLFDEELKAAEDTDLFLRIARKFGFDFINEYLIVINRLNTDRVTNRFDVVINAYKIIYDKHKAEINLRKPLRIKYNYKMMWLSYINGFYKDGRSFFFKCISDRIFDKKIWFIFCIYELLPLSAAKRIHLRL